MAIKWIVTDMDGTLLDREDKIMPLTRRCLMKCQELGIRVILASGRSYTRLMPYVKELNLDKEGGVLIEVNGMAVNYLTEGRRLVDGRLKKPDIYELFPALMEMEVEVQGYLDAGLRYWYPESYIPIKEKERRERNLPEDYPWVGGAWTWVTDNRDGYPDQVRVNSPEDFPEEINKFGISGDPEYMQKVFDILNERFGDRYEFVRTCPRLIEISKKGINKGNTLKRLMEMENIRPEEVMAFGDGENDVDMFRQVKYSIAMGNAEDFVKEQAYDVTDSNYEDGIAHAIMKYVGLDMEEI